MNKDAAAQDGLFPGWERENKQTRKEKPTRAELIAEFSKFLRESMRPEIRGFISTSAAARVMGVSEQYVRDLIREQKIRRTWFPLAGINGVWSGDVKAWMDAKAAKARAKAKAKGLANPGGDDE